VRFFIDLILLRYANVCQMLSSASHVYSPLTEETSSAIICLTEVVITFVYHWAVANNVTFWFLVDMPKAGRVVPDLT
jgi:hypothetical protein